MSVLLVYGSDLYSGIDFMKCIIQSLMAFCMEVISPSPTLENKLSIASFRVWPWWIGCLQEKPRNSAHCIDTLNVCVFYVPMCVLTLSFFFCPNCVTPSTVSQLNTLSRYQSCAGQASSFPFRLWTVITGSWLPVRLNQSFPRWGLIGLKGTAFFWKGGGGGVRQGTV